MDAWNIIVIILVVINVIAFGTAILVSYEKWKKERKKDWKTPLMGIFFLPICVLIAIIWPCIKYKMYRDEKKEKEKWALRKKKMEESKKFHFLKFGFRLKNLPFNPSSQEIIYVENEYNERINRIVKDNFDYIQECLDNSKYYQSTFVYLPTLIEQLSHDKTAIDYFAPYVQNKKLSTDVCLNSSYLLDFMAVPENRTKITPCFARYRGEESGCSLFECVGFDPEEGTDEKVFIEFLCSAFDYFPRPTGPAYQTIEKKDDEVENSNIEVKFDKASMALMDEIADRISKLRKMGISQWALEQLVKPEQKLSGLLITKDCRLLLPEYNNMEIKMEPLTKAVYLLFLRHPEGILFKHLPDYREELAQIYDKLRPLGLNERSIQSIEDVTNPLLNSINEKCARIRGAFLEQFDEHLAKNYFITGKRGEAKKITLPRDLVVWE